MNGNRLASIALGLLAVGILALGWFLGVAPKLAEAARADTERVQVEAQNAAYEAAIANLATQYENIDELRNELRELQEFIPGGHDLEDFIDALDAAAAANGVTIASINISEPTPFAAAVEDGAAPADSASGGSILFSLGLTVQVNGALPQVMGFLGQAQTLKRIYFVGGASIIGNAGVYTADLTGSVFVIADPANLDPPEDQTPKPTETPEPTPTETPAP